MRDPEEARDSSHSLICADYVFRVDGLGYTDLRTIAPMHGRGKKGGLEGENKGKEGGKREERGGRGGKEKGERGRKKGGKKSKEGGQGGGEKAQTRGQTGLEEEHVAHGYTPASVLEGLHLPCCRSIQIISTQQHDSRRQDLRPGKNPIQASIVADLDGRNRARAIADSLARVIAAIRITSVRWRSYLPLKTQNLVVDPAFAALRFESRDRRSLVQYSFHVDLRNGLRELTAFAER